MQLIPSSRFISSFPIPIALTEELDSVTSELHAVDIQIQELMERQQELIQKKAALTKKIKQCLEDSGAGTSNEYDSSPAAWKKEGLLFFSPLLIFVSFPFLKVESSPSAGVCVFRWAQVYLLSHRWKGMPTGILFLTGAFLSFKFKFYYLDFISVKI